ncbi:hypothetical protein DFH06DRAFT_1122190 [Mycena polygramma]|nr:hypothetical protein DFH06DRAFT_1122190 [Mycena polygramma]
MASAGVIQAREDLQLVWPGSPQNRCRHLSHIRRSFLTGQIFRWEGPVVLNLDDMDVIPATYVLQYPFFQNGSSYTAQIFQYDTTTLEVVVPNVHNTTFIWVNQPGQNV